MLTDDDGQLSLPILEALLKPFGSGELNTEHYNHQSYVSKHKISSRSACIFNPMALRKAKIVYNFGLSECNRVKVIIL